MAQLEHIEAIEKRLWSAADNLRANSTYASNEYFMPVMGLIFLRHAYSRYLVVKGEIIAKLPKRAGKSRELTKEDFSQKGAIYLRPLAEFDYLVSLTDSQDRAKAIINAMESIEEDYETLRDTLPKNEYRELSNDVLGQLLRTLNPDELKKVSGDVFGRIYEYFLTQFADLKAHDGGEFFTPVSLVSFIANVLEPDRGIVLDPACGSGSMFVQSARFVEEQHANPIDRLTFYGMEKNATTIRLAKMNLAVHGLEGNIRQAITYYEDPHELYGKANFVMANPPFNVDEIDAEKVKNDPRLPFGLPGVNKQSKISNGNYAWISYFYSYLSPEGRAGFVMSSQASSAGRDEAKLRQKLIESGAVDIMVAIRSNFFYTRTVPCELWFLNRGKSEEFEDKVLMLDARNVYRKVTRKIFDFSPEQEKNLLAVVWLYRGQQERFRELVLGYCRRVLEEGNASLAKNAEGSLNAFQGAFSALLRNIEPFIVATRKEQPGLLETYHQLLTACTGLKHDKEQFQTILDEGKHEMKSPAYLPDLVAALANVTEESRDLIKRIEHLFKEAGELVTDCQAVDSKDHDDWKAKEINAARKALQQEREICLEQLKKVRYFWKQAHWLTEKFPDAKYQDISGLVKLVDREELKKNDWSITPGRYVGVAPEEGDEDFDFGEVIRGIHEELEELNADAVSIAAAIKKNFEELQL